MPHFFIKKEEEIKGDFIELSQNDNFFHITRSLRCKIGEIIKFIDENKIIYSAKIEEITKKSLRAKILNKENSSRFLKYDIVLIQSILAPDGENLAIANATQTGVREIYPVISDNISSKKNIEKVEKWKKIALENSKQCERADIPTIHEVDSLFGTISKFKKENVLIFAENYENKTLNNCLSDIDLKEKIAVIVGPEGGFSNREFEYFIKNNYKLITLGKMIYKAPNAITCAISNIISRIEND